MCYPLKNNVAYFPFEREPFWQYLSRLNDYRAQYVLSMHEKWEICDVILEGITHETRATLESMCYGGLFLLNVDDMWDLFESLTSYQWQYNCASESFACPSPPPYDLHAQSPFINLGILVIAILFTLLMYALITNLLTMM